MTRPAWHDTNPDADDPWDDNRPDLAELQAEQSEITREQETIVRNRTAVGVRPIIEPTRATGIGPGEPQEPI